MNGSKKQIKWATEIQAKFAAEAAPLLGKPGKELLDRAVNLILSIDNASFWIDYREYDLRTLLGTLQRGGLNNKGHEFSNTIKIDATLTITETWDVIVSDGKGGHTETKSKVW